jgi:dolichyl-phosphate-mannose-protein mannosyltransferase
MTELKKYLNPKTLILIIIIFAALTRLYNLNYPNKYVFDEVYHAFTAKEFALNHKEAWEWWTTPPPGVAYEWTHPPLAKEIMASSMIIFHTFDSWAYRLPGALLGILSIFLLFKIALIIFKNETVALTAAFLFSIDGLNFVQSRTGMNDIYLVTAILASLLLFLNKKFFWSAVLLGLAFASKWTAIYFIGVYLVLLIKDKQWSKIPYFFLIPIVVYLMSYIPFFLLGHDLETFWHLQQQMWWYHTGLKAHHDYASPWWSWPFNLYPVWYFVDYHQNSTVSNIFASGNPLLFWAGAAAVATGSYYFLRRKAKELFVPLLGFFAFWLPWAISPRIMFLYHYAPSVPFMCMILASEIAPLSDKKDKTLFYLVIIAALLSFLLMYPFLVGVPLSRDIMQLFFRSNLTKNPFGVF